MQKDKHITKVSFWIEPDQTFVNNVEMRTYNSKDVLAFFPEIHNIPGGTKRGVYSHIGQHSYCPVDYIDECLKATPNQYQDLMKELEGMGYNLEIV